MKMMSEESVKAAYEEVRIGNKHWTDFAKIISRYIDQNPNRKITEISEEIGLKSSLIHRYTKSYAFLKKHAPEVLKEKGDISANRIDKLRRLLEKQPEFFEDKDMHQYTLDVLYSSPELAKKLLLEKVEGAIKVPEEDVFHTELLIRVVFDKVQKILKDPKAKAELKNKTGPILHDCAMALESIHDPKFADSLQKGELDLAEFLEGEKE